MAWLSGAFREPALRAAGLAYIPRSTGQTDERASGYHVTAVVLCMVALHATCNLQSFCISVPGRDPVILA
jgi:hypothetical protein